MTTGKQKHVSKSQWWKSHEIVSALFERLFRPIESEVLHDTRQREVVGKLRQLDVGVLDSIAGERRVVALVEVQKRKTKVGLEDFGNWIYKRDTINAKELVAISESGFAKSVIDHARDLHSGSVRLGILHAVPTGLFEGLDSNCLGITRIQDLWGFASIFVQYADADEIVAIPLPQNMEENIFGGGSPVIDTGMRIGTRQRAYRSNVSILNFRLWRVVW
jgi:hypothetical protein